MKHLTRILSASALLIFAFNGCATTKAKASIADDKKPGIVKVEYDKNTYEKKVAVATTNTPSWVNNPGHGNSIGIGESYIGKKSLSFQRKTAVHNAQIEMARNIKADVGELLKNYQAISGESNSNTFDDFVASYSEGILTETLRNTQVSKSFKDKDGNLYVLLVPSSYVQKKYELDKPMKDSVVLGSRDNLDAKWSKFQLEEMQKEYQSKLDKKSASL